MPSVKTTLPKLWSAKVAAAILLGMLGGCDSERGMIEKDPPMASVESLIKPLRQAGTQDRSHNLDGARTTAIVEAATRVSPAVVSVNVIRTEQMQTRSFF
ncbi:uncharacterized protein METZ01_LOCUS474243, partial [marine metagenome]